MFRHLKTPISLEGVNMYYSENKGILSKLLTVQPATEDLAFYTLPLCLSPWLGGDCQCCLV